MLCRISIDKTLIMHHQAYLIALLRPLDVLHLRNQANAGSASIVYGRKPCPDSCRSGKMRVILSLRQKILRTCDWKIWNILLLKVIEKLYQTIKFRRQFSENEDAKDACSFYLANGLNELDEASSLEVSMYASNSKRNSDHDPDNPKSCKSRKPMDNSLLLSCKYSKVSFCGIEYRLPDGFYDAGHDLLL
ncbi:hypothetical protein S83_006117 [Arachis hypogaea]